ncbi:hypothetical protein QO004_001990 [Rhizobium mesoamericanum]|uniref:hypothetical protein n=1 Tax=Rhizobium mesoamericanum TaxID=1079800 RepID=UPI002787D7C3|nr:hypothetical protein [Rhizobium mesoamericanum]MDQ0560208.1 hypothetical protein [Rhizobium mesoamericanum]
MVKVTIVVGDRLPVEGMKRPSLGRSASARSCSEIMISAVRVFSPISPDSANALLTNAVTKSH